MVIPAAVLANLGNQQFFKIQYSFLQRFKTCKWFLIMLGFVCGDSNLTQIL
jgi:hypothetical protein